MVVYYLPQTVLALWGSQFGFRVGDGVVADSGSRWDPSRDPKLRNHRQPKENQYVCAKASETTKGKQMCLRRTFKTKEKSCFAKTASKTNGTSKCCTKSLPNQGKPLLFVKKVCKTMGKYVCFQKTLAIPKENNLSVVKKNLRNH